MIRVARAGCRPTVFRVSVGMRNFPCLLPVVVFALLLSGCDRSGDSVPVPGDPPEKKPVPTAEDTSSSTVDDESPALTESAIESLILDALTPNA